MILGYEMTINDKIIYIPDFFSSVIQCSSTCGRGLQHRIVTCRREDILCDFALRPLSRQACKGHCNGDKESWNTEDGEDNIQYQADYLSSYQDGWLNADESTADSVDYDTQNRHKQVPISFGEWEKMKSHRAGPKSRLLDNLKHRWSDSAASLGGGYGAHHEDSGSDGTSYDIDYNDETLILDADEHMVDPDGFMESDDVRQFESDIDNNADDDVNEIETVTPNVLTLLQATDSASETSSIKTTIDSWAHPDDKTNLFQWMVGDWTVVSMMIKLYLCFVMATLPE